MRYIKDLDGNYYRLENITVKVSAYDSTEWRTVTVIEEVSQAEARELDRKYSMPVPALTPILG